MFIKHKKQVVCMHQSPLRQKDIQQLTEDKRQVLHQLQNLFTYYASKFDRHSYHELSHKAFIEIIARLLKKQKPSPHKQKESPQKLPQQRREEKDLERSLQLLYYSKSNAKEGATFQQFLDLIPQMANVLYRSMNKDQRVQLLISDLRFLYKKEVLTILEGRLINISFVFRQDTLNYVARLISEFEKIYRVYFAHELNHNIKKGSYKNESLRSFFTFLKEFEVFPKLVTAGQAYFIYNQALLSPHSDCLVDQQPKPQQGYNLDSTDKPMCFTLGKFISCLIIVAKNCYPKLRQLQSIQQADNEKEAFKALLQQIEMNKAYKNSRHLRQTNESYSFILPDEYPKEIELIQSRRTITEQKARGIDKKSSEFLRLLNNMDL